MKKSTINKKLRDMLELLIKEAGPDVLASDNDIGCAARRVLAAIRCVLEEGATRDNMKEAIDALTGLSLLVSNGVPLEPIESDGAATGPIESDAATAPRPIIPAVILAPGHRSCAVVPPFAPPPAPSPPPETCECGEAPAWAPHRCKA